MSDYELFLRYPQLRKKVLRENLGDWPTPLQKLESLSALLGKKVFVKRDDLTSRVYGGNKVRKLELLFADVRRRGKNTIITAGGLGSHHVLAAGALGRELGLETVGLFFCQPINEHVQANLLLDKKFGTRMFFVRDYKGVAWEYLRHYMSILKNEKQAPYILLPGGSTPLSTLGYINAVLEMQTQLKEKGLPDPGAIFVAGGTGGTAAGLLAGVHLAQMQTVVHAVQVVPSVVLNHKRVVKLAFRALLHLSSLGVDVNEKSANLAPQLVIDDNYLGDGYGFPTPEGKEAVSSFFNYENIELENCYTGKAAASLMDYCRGETVEKERPVIFVNTYSSTHEKPEPELFKNVAEIMPEEFLWCFEGGPCRRPCKLNEEKRFCENRE